MVLKPSEIAPMSGLIWAEVASGTHLADGLYGILSRRGSPTAWS